jgi:hypothetical protein
MTNSPAALDTEQIQCVGIIFGEEDFKVSHRVCTRYHSEQG